MSNAEWINSIPGNDPRKGVFLNCVGCHTLERVMRSTHDADDFLKITLPRMQSYVNQSIPQHPQLRKAERLMEERGDSRVQIYKPTADFLATVNLSVEAAVELPAQSDAAAGRPRHARDLHRIRPAARDHRAARRDRR